MKTRHLFLPPFLIFLSVYFSGCEQNYGISTSTLPPPPPTPVESKTQEFAFINHQTIETKKDLDILFVIDNSVSMASYQQSLKSSFNSFVNTNLAPSNGDTPIERFCIGFITTDAYLKTPNTIGYNSSTGGFKAFSGILSNPTLYDSKNIAYTNTGEYTSTPHLISPRKFCSHDAAGNRIANATIIQYAQNAMNTIGTQGDYMELSLSSLNSFIDNNENTSSKLFRKGTFKSVVFISDEPESYELFRYPQDYPGLNLTNLSGTKTKLETFFRTVDGIPALQTPEYHVINVILKSSQNHLSSNNSRWSDFNALFGKKATMRSLGVENFNDILGDLISQVKSTIELKTHKFALDKAPILDSIEVIIESNTIKKVVLTPAQYTIDGQWIYIDKTLLNKYLEDDSAKITLKYNFYP